MAHPSANGLPRLEDLTVTLVRMRHEMHEFMRETIKDIKELKENVCDLKAIMMGSDMTHDVRMLELEVRKVHGNIRALEYNLDGCNFNNCARLHNSRIHDHETPIVALHDVLKDVPIPGFPRTYAALAQMTPPVITRVLDSLLVDVTGSHEVRLQRLRFAIGMPGTYI